MENTKDYDHDSMVDRNRLLRFSVFLGSMFAIIGLPTFLGAFLFKMLGLGFLGLSLGFGFGVYVAMTLFPYFWITVPQTSAFVTTLLFTIKDQDPNVPYGPGGHFALPWEMRAESGNITLDILTISFCEAVPAKGSSVIVEGTVQFKFDLKHITTVVGIDVETIKQGFIDQIKEWLSDTIGKMSSEEAKNSVKRIREMLETEFREVNSEQLLSRYGIRFTSSQIASIDFPPKVQEVRDSIEEARQIGLGVAMLLGYSSTDDLNTAREQGKITEAEISRAREDFLAASGNLKKEVRRIDATGLERATPGAGIIAGLTGNS